MTVILPYCFLSALLTILILSNYSLFITINKVRSLIQQCYKTDSLQDHALMNGSLSYCSHFTLSYNFYDKKKLTVVQAISYKTSTKSLFDFYIPKFQPRLEICPICGNTSNWHIHDYYDCSIINFQTSKHQKSNFCMMRVFCDNCEHAHAILPDITIPYSSYSPHFILHLLGQCFAGLFAIDQLCERYEISQAVMIGHSERSECL